MGVTDVFSLIGGLALFLYGMKIMGDGLELIAGQRLKQVLEKLTSNRLMGLIVGLVVTALIQSSSATTVMLVGFVNAGLMSVAQTVGVIMGANIGTSVTAQLIALNISEIAPLFAFAGVALIMFFRGDRLHYMGQVVAGLGILFIGMGTMSDAMRPLRDMPEFISLLTRFENPVLGILVGAGFTAIIQSSSASIGILQALAMQNLVTLPGCIYVVFGMNIGTCITAIIASLGANRAAKRVAMVHLSFKIVGTLLFSLLMIFLPFVDWIMAISPGNISQQIANAHSLFNIVAVALLFPFAGQFAVFAHRVIPEAPTSSTAVVLKYLDAHTMGAPALALHQVRQELTRMAGLAQENVRLGMAALIDADDSHFDAIKANEDIVDALDHEITNYLVRLNQVELSSADAGITSAFAHVTSDLERISDHSENLMERAAERIAGQVDLSDTALDNLRELEGVLETLTENCVRLIRNADEKTGDRDALRAQIADEEQSVDDLVTIFKNSHVQRAAKGECTPESGYLFLNSLTDIERIGDHAMNISEKL